MKWYQEFKASDWLLLALIAIAASMGVLHIFGKLGPVLCALVKDWATLVGALFTLSATLAALWLGTQQLRAQRADALTRAEIMAGAVAPKVEHWRRELDLIVKQLPKTHGNEGRDIDVPATRAAFEQLGALSAEELIALAPIGRDCVSRLASLGGLANQAEQAFEKGLPYIGVPADFDIRGHHHSVALESSRTAYGNAKVALAHLKSFLESRGVSLRDLGLT